LKVFKQTFIDISRAANEMRWHSIKMAVALLQEKKNTRIT